MPNVAQVLKEEISRLARKEIRASCDPLRKQVQSLRRAVRSQQTTIDRLEKSLSKMVQMTATDAGTSLYAPTEEKEQGSRARVSPASIRRHRHRLKLSQAELGRLLNVSTNTIVRWEQGSSRPRAQHRTALVRLRDLVVRDVKQILSE